MSKREKVLPTWKELKEDLKPMTFQQKVDHLWTYYRIYLVGILFAVLMVVMAISAFINANRDIVVSGMMANGYMTQEGYDYLTVDYAEYLGLEGKQEVELLTTNFTSLADPTSGEDNSAAAQKLVLQVASGAMDYAIIDGIAMEFYAVQDVFSDLRTIFPAEIIAELEAKDMLYYIMVVDDDTDLDNLQIDTDTAERIPIGIKIQSLPFVQDTLYGGEYYFCATSHDPDVDLIIGVWEYILAWEKK